MSRGGGNERRPTRRAFLYAVGGAAGAAIAGWVLISQTRRPRTPSLPSENSPRGPALSRDLAITPTADGADVLRAGHSGKSPVCRVNDLGRYLLEQMDGRKSVSALARSLRARLQSPPADVERFQSGVAAFIAELGKAGMLEEPFYVNIYNGEVTA